MGITVISSPVAVIASNAGLPASDNAAVLATDGIAIDFAALLTGQLSGNEQLFAAATTSAATKDQATTRERPAQEDQERDIISEMLFAQDAAPSNQTIIPYIPPAVENRLPPDVDRSTSPNLKLKSEFTNDLPGTGDKGINQAISSFEQKATLSFEQKTTSVSGAPPRNPESALATTSTQPQGEAAILAGETNAGNSALPSFAAIMAGQTTHSQRAQPSTPGNTPSVSTPLQDNRWAQDFGERIVWIAKNDQQVAQINISPAQLGPVQITLNLNGDQASLSFASPHAEVRKAIEDAMPNLREMLSSAGISLGQSNVGAQLPQQQRDSNAQFANGNRSAGENAILPADSHSGSTSSGLPVHRGRGMVDLFA